MNTLYYGDNLDVLRKHIGPEAVDLIYLDPPFKSDQSYNVLFRERDGTCAAAQVQAFEDTWHWDERAARTYRQIVEEGGRLGEALGAFRTLVGESDMLAYLSMMAPRLKELHRVLKPSGSLYLHCDPTSGHYLKILLDAVFTPLRFKNEIIWQRGTPKSLMKRRLPSSHDVILVYDKSETASWNDDAVYTAYDMDDLDEKTDSKYSLKDPGPDGERYQLTSLINPNHNRPNLTYEFLGITRVWRWTRDRMEKALKDGLIVQTSPSTVPRFKRYLRLQRGKPFTDIWSDIPPVNARAQERLGYPTQKPVTLLERIISLSSKPGDIVLDPFCGCGTAIAAAQKLKRQWIGIDITHVAIGIIRHRIEEGFNIKIKKDYQVKGEPTSIFEAASLAEQDRFQFQVWAVNTLAGRPVETKKGSDKGIDGKLLFHDEAGGGGSPKMVIISVKSGGTGVGDVRDLRGVIDRENAAIGVLVILEESTRDMRTEAAAAGRYRSPVWTTEEYPRIQIITIEKMLTEGARIKMPPLGQTNQTLPSAKPRKSSPGKKGKGGDAASLFK